MSNRVGAPKRARRLKSEMLGKMRLRTHHSIMQIAKLAFERRRRSRVGGEGGGMPSMHTEVEFILYKTLRGRVIENKARSLLIHPRVLLVKESINVEFVNK